MIMIWITVVLGVVLGWANAQAIEPNDFAYGYRLEVSEDAVDSRESTAV